MPKIYHYQWVADPAATLFEAAVPGQVAASACECPCGPAPGCLFHLLPLCIGEYHPGKGPDELLGCHVQLSNTRTGGLVHLAPPTLILCPGWIP